MIDANYNLAPQLTERLKRYQNMAALIGLVGLALTGFGYFSAGAQQFLRSYLVGWVFWTGAGLGSLGLLMVGHLTGGSWSTIVRRPLEAGSRTLYIMLLLFFPIALGAGVLYEWADPAKLAVDKVIQDKHAYLNIPFFQARWVIYMVLWMGMTYLLNKWSHQEDGERTTKYALKMEYLSGPGLVLFFLTVTFASVDWIMSLDPHWFSTIYGFYLAVSQGLSALALIVFSLVILGGFAPMDHVITKKHLHDLGKLLFALTMLWAYLNFSQLIIIWAGNLPEEIPFYVRRLNGGWEWVGGGLLLFHFIFPFFLLLSQGIKKNPKTLRWVAIWLVLIRVVDVIFQIEPTFSRGDFNIHWLDLAAPIGLGGVWFALFFWQLPKYAILPVGSPDLEKALNHGRDH